MKIVPSSDAQVFDRREAKRPEAVIAREYPTKSKRLSVAEVTVIDRYPATGFALNANCVLIAYVVDGDGSIYSEGERHRVSPGFVVEIDQGEKYFWDTDGVMTLIVASSPPWTPEQHRYLE